MNIFDYIKRYGDYSFSEKEFNEVDNTLFSCLSYINYSNIVSSTFKNKITLQELGEIVSKVDDNIISKKIFAVRNAVTILKQIKNKKRYKDILVYNYQRVVTRTCQFSAVSFDLDNRTTYISYEGSNEIISGWREDLLMAITFNVPSQVYSIKYLNRYIFKRKKLIVGGHSKGGHLAIIASMYCNCFVKKKIINIYSNDGLGIRKEEYLSNEYKSIKDRIIKIIPEYSVVGELLCGDNCIVVKATKKDIKSHNPSTWIVDGNKFQRSIISKTSLIIKNMTIRLNDKYDYETKRKVIDLLYEICNKYNIRVLDDFKGKKRIIIKEILESNKISMTAKEMFKEVYNALKEGKKMLKEKEDHQ